MAEEGTSNGLAFAFSGAAKKPTRKIDLHERDDGPKKDVLTGIGPDGGLQSAEQPPAPKGPKIIPKQGNTYKSARPGYVPSFVPDAATDNIETQGINNFETAEHDTAIAQDQVTYGLIKRSREGNGSNANASAKASEPLSEAELLKRDLKELPPVASLDEYEEMPVEAFGEALLRGMGWSEGRAIGRGNKKEVTAKELVRRPHRLGLGAAPAPAPETHKKYIKPGETRLQQDMVYVDPSTGAVKSSKPVDAPLTAREAPGVRPGKVMEIIDGRHRGLKCEVQSLESKEPGRSERAKVRLLPSYEVVVVRCSELDEVRRGTSDSRSKSREGRNEKRPGSSASREDERDAKRKKEERKRDYSPPPTRKKAEEEPWLVPNIRVKIIDKRLEKGRYYLKKGVVVDVKSPTVCDVFIDDLKKSVLDVKQSQLETVVPGVEGTPIQILLGKLAGKRGRLLQRNTSTGLAAVQLTSDLSVHKMSLDDIAEYCGPTEGWDE